MVHGGTNFGYSGDSYDATYDYSAPIGETGQFHNLYFPARRAAWFAQSFSPLLTGSHNDPDFAKADVHDFARTTRTNPTGAALFSSIISGIGAIPRNSLKSPPQPPHISAGG